MPEWRHEIRRRLEAAKLRPEREAEIIDEVAQHLDEHYAERLAMGDSTEAAEAAARRELETGDLLAREVRRAEPAPPPLPPVGEPARGRFFSALWQDVRYSVRRLAKRPAFTITALAILALTIGPATTVVGIADALFFRLPTGIARPSRLMTIDFADAKSGSGTYSPWSISYDMADSLVARSTTVSALAGQSAISGGFSVPGGETRRLDGQAVRSNYFQTLGVRIIAGRPLTTEDEAAPGGMTSIVLAEPIAIQYFGNVQSAIGRAVQINSVPFTVVGVSAADFAGTQTATPARFWISGFAYYQARHLPVSSWTMRPNRGPTSQYIARLKPGVTVEAAVAELSELIKALPDPPKSPAIRLQIGLGAPKSLNVQGMTIVRVLSFVAIALVLLGIANVANLLLFQGLKLGREVAVRKALGASVSRLVQMALVESVLLSSIGAAMGIGVALAIARALPATTIRGLGTIDVAIDWRVIGITAVIALLSGLVFGVGPALAAARGKQLASLGRGARNEAPGAARLRQMLAAAQLALSLTLLVGALLFVATLRQLRAVDLGFVPDHVSTMWIDLRSHGYDRPRTWQFYQQLIARVSERPEVEQVAMGHAVPGVGISTYSSLFLPGEAAKDARETAVNYVTADYFTVLKIPVTRGRAFTPAESFVDGDADIVILSASSARALFGDADPINRIVVEPGRPANERRVIGVTPDVRWMSLTDAPPAVMYMPFSAGIASVSSGMIVARSSRSASEMTRIFREAAAAIDPATPLFREQSLEDALNVRLARERLFAVVTTLLGAIAFVLAAIGLHGVMSQMVTERSREFGIRVAIGASRRDVIGLVMRLVLRIAVAGGLAGVGAALLAGKYISAYLYGVTTRDPATFAGAVVLLTAVVIIAVIAPVRAALRVQPIDVLRSE